MDCCSVDRGLNRLFGGRLARRWASGFRKRAEPDKRYRALLERLEGEGIDGASVLDIGFGVGDLHFELLRRGAGSVAGVEISSAMAEQAGELAGGLGFEEQVDYRIGDYTQIAEELGDADIVVLDRSLCCYPNWHALVEPSARHARRFYVLTLPRDSWYMHAMMRGLNLGLRVIRHEYRAYMHPRDEIDAALAAAGLTPVLTSSTWRDDVALYARA